MRRIRWTPEAFEQLEAAFEHIQEDSPGTARDFAQDLLDRIGRLSVFPGLGRLGGETGTRELVIAPYVVVYRISDAAVEILEIWHGAQDWR